ncbi:MAG TPA: MlaD family protein [Stellaceae bacterium]|nr:MlaD family protein [Stellaceae bacterium]
METRANYVMVGSFVLVILAGIFVAILWLAHAQFNQQFVNYDIFFTGSVTGLSVGAPVNLNGVAIGRVTEIRLDPVNPDQVRVTIEADAQAPIKSDSVASLELTGITGIYYIEISGGTREAPPITREEGQRYPVIAAKPSRFASLVASAPEVMNRVIEVADRLSQILDDKNRQAIAQTLANVEQISEIASRDADKVDAIIDDTKATVGDFRKTTMPLVNGSLTDLQKALVSANAIVNDLSVTAKGLNVASGHLDALIQENRPGLRDFSQGGLNDLHALISDARVLVAGLTRVVAEIERDPTRFLFGEKREGYKPK